MHDRFNFHYPVWQKSDFKHHLIETKKFYNFFALNQYNVNSRILQAKKSEITRLFPSKSLQLIIFEERLIWEFT